MKHRLSLVIAVLACLLNTQAAPKPNIVVILADDLGWEDVGWHGKEIKTPNLDGLAMSAARLEQFYVQPVCSPTRAALMTGRYPIRHGLQVGVVRPWAQYGLPLEERTLAQALKEAGYTTAICGKWHLGHFQRAYLPTQRGFDYQYGHYNGAIDYFEHTRDDGFDWHRNDRVCRDEGYSTALLAREAVRIIKEQPKDKPLFLYVPFNAVHAPHQVPEKYKEPYANLPEPRRTYAGMIAAMDQGIGQIVASLEEKGLRTNTMILFSSDNGGPSPGRVTSNGELRAGKATVYEGGVRVCAFVNWPGRIKPRIVNEPMHIVDWYPTLLKVAGASLDQPLPVDGTDILPCLTDGKSLPRREILLNAAPAGGAIRSGDWKLVLNGAAADEEVPAAEGEAKKKAKQAQKYGESEAVELFNLADDPGERKNLASSNVEKVKELRAKYDHFARQAAPPKLKPKAEGFKSPEVWGE